MSNERREEQIRRQERPAMGALFDAATTVLQRTINMMISYELGQAIQAADKACESEIEKLFLVAWMANILRDNLNPGNGHWSSQYSIITDTPERTQRQAYTEILSDPHPHLAPDSSRDIGIDRIDYIFPQLTVGRYRADFVLVRWYANRELKRDADGSYIREANGRYPFESRKSARCALVAVECDGHDFHEKTKEQAQRDKERDRYFVTAGFQVLRFTGSEIFRNAMKCADEVEKFLFRNQFAEAFEGRLP